ncbi:hypothetical protein GGH19_003578 [Coemansia sp. RSA 1807]|nr:hypothetical protein J3F82_000750 [Coemansia sp. RSA 637]KAJ2183098.1 hypothetical protein GGF45_000352 [Coemansia sp. RSA 551]KAJ2536897.1 hypothetical protein IWW43_000470 [Coemansia sp. RSA 1935]KAJ2574739.1 hypothetical protein GGH19_003578 [Coemansia sp. RSA 1807]
MAADKLPQNARKRPLPVDIACSGSSRAHVAAHSYDARLSRMLGSSPTSSLSQAGSAYLWAKQNERPRSMADSDSASSSRRVSMARTEVARRLKQHLVTRPSSHVDSSLGGQPQQAHSFNAALLIGHTVGATSPPSVKADDCGYAADINEDDACDASTVPGNGEVVDPLQLASGDMTHQIYRWHLKHDVHDNSHGKAIASHPESAAAAASTVERAHVARRRSFSGWDSDSEWDISFRPAQINVPGGFRRQFVRERAERLGRAPPGFIAETFVDFIALYGHFAGGNYLSDEDKEYFDRLYEQQESEGDEEPTERTPLRRIPSNLHGTASNKKAFFLIIKAFVGTGVLVLPRAFYNGGLLTACVLMVLVAWYAWHCILLLAEVYLQIGGGSYSDIGRRLYGRWMQYAVTSSIVLAQIGGCCAYTIFVAQNWRNVFNTLSGCRVQLSTEFWVLVQMLVFVPLALIRQIRYFAPVALVANVLIIVSLGYLLGFDLWAISTHGPAPFVNYNPARFPLLVGTAVYSFEGVTLVIPILESLRDKRSFSRVLTLAIMLCLGLFLCVGSLSYLTFGDRVEAVVLLNLPNTSAWTLLVQILYSVAILFSMPLQLFPAVRIMEAMMFVRSGRDFKSIKWQKNVFRTLCVLLIAMCAIFGADQLDNVVALVGSFCLVPLSFIYPASMHLRAVAQTRRTRIKDSLLIGIGVVAMAYVTYISVITWGTSDPPINVCTPGP